MTMARWLDVARVNAVSTVSRADLADSRHCEGSAIESTSSVTASRARAP